MKKCKVCGKEFEPKKNWSIRCDYCETNRLNKCGRCGHSFKFNQPMDKFCTGCVRTKPFRSKKREKERINIENERKINIDMTLYSKEKIIETLKKEGRFKEVCRLAKTPSYYLETMGFINEGQYKKLMKFI